MRKKWKRPLAFLLALTLIFSGVQFMSTRVQADSSTDTKTDLSSAKTVINTWDFNEKAQLTDDFMLYKRNGDGVNFVTSDGKLSAVASTSSDCRKAVLNTKYTVKETSVDIYPVDGVYYGGIMLGVTGKVRGGTTANPSIMVSVEDSNVSDNNYKLRVYGYDPNIEPKEFKILDDQEAGLVYSDQEAQAVNLKVEISESTLKITLTLLSDTASAVNEGTYQCEVDIATYRDKSGNTIFSKGSLEGKVGLFARANATCFDNFNVVSYATHASERVYDFADSDEFSNDFTLYKRNNDGVNFTTSAGSLYAASSSTSDCRKAVLNAEYDMDAASVDIYPVDGVYNGGIMLGITGKVGGGTTANPSIMVFVEDTNIDNNSYKLKIYGYLDKKEHKILDLNKSSLLYSDHAAQPVNLKAEISESTLTITLTLLSETASAVNEGTYQCEVDIATYQDESGNTIFSKNSLEGKVGLFARAVATKFDDFALFQEMTVYDFEDSKEFSNAFSLYKRNTDGNHFTISDDGILTAEQSTASDCRKAILNALYDVEQLSVDIYPVEGKYYGGIMLGANKNDNLTYGGGVMSNPSVMVMVQDTGAGGNAITLRVNVYGDNDSDGKIDDVQILSKNYGGSSDKTLYKSKSAQAVRLTVQVDGTKLVMRLSLLANDHIYVEEQVDITSDIKGASTTFDSTTLEGKVGVIARDYATNFDDFGIKGMVSTEVDRAEELEVDGITATYTFENTKEMLDFDLYRSTITGGFSLNDGRLTVNTGKTEGEYKAILRGEGRVYQKVSIDIYPDENGLIYSGIYLGASNARAGWGSIDGVNILLQSDSADEDKKNQLTVNVGDYPDWKVLKKVNEKLFVDGVKEPVRLTVYIVGQELIISVSVLSDLSRYTQFIYQYEGNYDLTQGTVGIRSRNANNSFDNFTIVYQQSEQVSPEIDVKNEPPVIASPATGDNTMFLLCAVVMTASLVTVIYECNKRRKSSYN